MQDVSYAVRGLRKHALLSIIIIASRSVGFTVNALDPISYALTAFLLVGVALSARNGGPFLQRGDLRFRRDFEAARAVVLSASLVVNFLGAFRPSVRRPDPRRFHLDDKASSSLRRRRSRSVF